MRGYILLMLFSLGITVLLTPMVRRLALTFKILTPLRERDVHVVPTPRTGGIAITAGFLLALFLGSRMSYFRPVFENQVIWSIIMGTIAICILGVIDDIWELDWMAKLAGQLMIAGMMALGGVQLISFPVFGLTIGSSRLSILVSVLILVAIINAVNFVDGLDGLAAGLICIGGGSFFLYSYILIRMAGAQTFATTSAAVMIALVGSCIGFLWYNFHPASIFMGDSGAMVLGLVMGSAAITVTGQINPAQLEEKMTVVSALPILLPLIVLVIPIVNLVLTASRRLAKGNSPFTADRTHLHDQLLNMGHSHRGVVIILYAWTALACGVGISLLVYDQFLVVTLGLCLTALLAVGTRFFLPGMWGRLNDEQRKGIGVPGGGILRDDGIVVIARAQPLAAQQWVPDNGDSGQTEAERSRPWQRVAPPESNETRED